MPSENELPQEQLPQKPQDGNNTFMRLIKSWNSWHAPQIYHFVRIIVAVVLIYFCVYILQFVGQAPKIYNVQEDGDVNSVTTIQLDEETEKLLSSPLASSRITLSGQTSPDSVVQLLILEKVVASDLSDGKGIFSLEDVDLPSWTSEVKIRVVNSQLLYGSTTIKRYIRGWDFNAFTPEIKIASYIPELQRLWIVGTASPDSSIEILTDADDLLAVLQTNQLGVFESFVLISDDSPVEIVPKVINGSLTSSEKFTVYTTPLQELPLARIATVDAGKDKSVFAFQVTLPLEHPYFNAVVDGTLDIGTFIKFSFGGFSYYRGTDVFLVGSSYRNLVLEWEQPIFTFMNQNGKVVVNSNYDGQLMGIGFYTYSQDGIGYWPFLSEQDRLTINHQGFVPEWFGDIYPIAADEKHATWTGPLSLGDSADALQVKFVSPTDTVRQTVSAEAEKLWDFIRKFNSRLKEISPLLYTVWSVGIFALPFLTLFFIRNSQLIDEKAMSWFLQIAIILGIGRAWYLFYYFIAYKGPGAWLNQIVLLFSRWAEFMFGFRKTEYSWSNANAASNAFWILFISMSILVLFFFSANNQTASEKNGKDDPKTHSGYRWFRELWVVKKLSSIKHYLINTKNKISSDHRWIAQLRFGVQITWMVLTIFAIREIYLRWSVIDGGMNVNLFAGEALFGIAMAIFIAFFLGSVGGWFGTFFGITLIVFFIRAAAHINGLESLYKLFLVPLNFAFSHSPIDALIIERVPWFYIQILVGISGFFFVAWLLKRIFPEMGTWKWVIWGLSAVIVLIAMVWLSIPPALLLTVGALSVSLSIGWLILQGIKFTYQENSSGAATQWMIYLFWVVIAVAIAWPIAKENGSVQFRDMFSLMSILDSRLPLVLFFIILLLLWRKIQDAASVFYSEEMLSAGGYLFAAVIVNNYSTIMLIPITFIIAWWIGKRWVFRPAGEIDDLRRSLGVVSEKHGTEIRNFVNRALYRRRLNSYQDGLRKKLDKNEIEPGKYTELLEAYRKTLEAEYEIKHEKKGIEDQNQYRKTWGEKKRNLRKQLISGEIDLAKYTDLLHQHRATFEPENSPKDETSPSPKGTVAFAIGFGNVQRNVMISMQTGILLSLIPIGIASYKYLPNISMEYPFPLAYIASFLVWACSPWFVYSFFFGFFYPHLRGDTGLSKGLWMALWVTIPQLTLYLVTLSQISDMTNFLNLSLQIFIFFSLLGLFMDIRVLVDNQFRSRDIVTVHELPKLAAFSSSILTALAPLLSTLPGWVGSNMDKIPGYIDSLKALWGE